MSTISDPTAIHKVSRALWNIKGVATDSPFYSQFAAPLAEATEACLQFSTKEEYLAWRAEWRKEYAQLTKDIRQAKRDRKGPPSVTKLNAMHQAQLFGAKATTMLYIRSQSKIKAARQRAETMNKV